MNILIGINKKYVLVAAVLLRSILENNKEFINLYVFHDDLTSNDEITLVNSCGEYCDRFKLHFVYVDDNTFREIHTRDAKRWPKTVYYRILVSMLLPDCIDRILYLDADMIIDGSLSPLYNVDFRTNCFAACEDTVVSNFIEYHKRLNIPDIYSYYNSGMILFNLQQMRQCVTTEYVKQIQNRYDGNLKFPDQDILNVMFIDKCICIDYRKYNFICSHRREDTILLKAHAKDAVIYHFAGGKHHRPWEEGYMGDYFEIYWKYAKNVYGESRYKELHIKYKVFKFIYRIVDKLEMAFAYRWDRLLSWYENNTLIKKGKLTDRENE